VLPAEGGGRGDAVELLVQLAELGLRRRPRIGVLGTGRRSLNGQVTHTLQDRRGLVERTFSGLHNRDAVLRVTHRDLQAADLGPETLADREACGVVGRPVDPVARRQLLQRLAHLAVRHRQVPVGVLSSDVVVNAKTHDLPP